MIKKLNILKKQFQDGTHSHAYLFYGELKNEIKKDTLKLAQILTGYERNKKNDPDILNIKPDPTKLNIPLAVVKNISHFLSFEPYSGKNKVVVIDVFHLASKEASSALLKILEEPPRLSVIILLSNYPAMILPTILSRVQKINFSHIDKGVDKDSNMFYAFNALVNGGITEKFSFIEYYIKKEENPGILLETWLLFFHDMVYIQQQSHDDFLHYALYKKDMETILKRKKYTTAKLVTIIKTLLYWKHILNTTNVNKRLLLENIALTF